MSKLEKYISKEVKQALSALEADGAVLWWERLQSGKIQVGYHWVQLCRIGTPDFIAILKGSKIYFIETKSDSGKQSPAQKAFEIICKTWATYEVVTDRNQVYSTVEKLTNHEQDKLDKITLD